MAVPLAEIDRCFHTELGDTVTRFVGDGMRDGRLRAVAVDGAKVAEFRGGDHAEQYSWMGEAEAFSSGIEGFLQAHIVLVLGSWPMTPRPVVVRVVTGIGDIARWHHAALADFVLVSAEFLDMLAAMADGWSYALAVGARFPIDETDEVADGAWWTRSNILGGHDLERLARGTALGAAYTGAIRFMSRDVTWNSLESDRDPLAENAGLLVDPLVLGPMLYAAFFEWSAAQLDSELDEDQRFWRESRIDARSTHLLDRATRPDSYRGGARPKGLSSTVAVAFAAYLQSQRLYQLALGLPRLIEVLCLPDDHLVVAPPLGRRGTIEVQMKIANLAPVFVAGDEQSAEMLAGVAEEMQVFLGLVAAVTLSNLGGLVYLEPLCRWDWSRVHAYFARMEADAVQADGAD